MDRRVSLAELNDLIVREPHDIYAVDPRVPEFLQEIDRIQFAADVVADHQRASVLPAPSRLLVELDSTDPRQHQQLQELVGRARAAE